MRSLKISFLMLFCIASAQAEVLEVGPGKKFEQLQQAVFAAQAGDTLRLTPGDHYDCAIVTKSDLIIEGAGKPEETSLTDKPCGGKAALVTMGENTTVRNLTLTRMRVPDGNGAGIRMEGRNLTVDHVRFINNEEGILGGLTPESVLTIRDSEFVHNGTCEQGCAHGVYVGQIALLHIERSRFYETMTAHHIKSRAARTEVIDCDIEDGPNGTASYEIELPIGGALLARGNTIVKGPKAENHTAAIMIGSEGVSQPTPELVIENNTFRKDGAYSTTFVVNSSATPAQLVGNNIQSGIKPLRGDGSVR